MLTKIYKAILAAHECKRVSKRVWRVGNAPALDGSLVTAWETYARRRGVRMTDTQLQFQATGLEAT